MSISRRLLGVTEKYCCRRLPLRRASRVLRAVGMRMILALSTAGCTHYGVSGPDDLGLAARFDPQKLPTTLTLDDPNPKLSRNQVLSQWLIRSDYLCADYLLQLSRSIRDTRLATDFLGTVLSGLATIFAQPAVTRPLSGSATIALGIGGDIQADLFLQQAGDVVSTAVQAVRTRARTELQKKFTAEYADYTLEQGLVDVQRYDRETCNLNVGLNEIRASLNTFGPAAPQANNPIVPLPAPVTGAGPSPESALSGVAPPLATTIIPPTVQNTPGGGLVLTPGKIVTTPATALPSSTAGPAPQQVPRPSGSRAVGPTVLHQGPQGPPCEPLPREALCRPLTPEFRKRRTTIADAVEKIPDVVQLQAIAQTLAVPTPVATKTCIQRNLKYHASHICTDDKLEEMEQAVPGLMK
jgi:hypothetical protein